MKFFSRSFFIFFMAVSLVSSERTISAFSTGDMKDIMSARMLMIAAPVTIVVAPFFFLTDEVVKFKNKFVKVCKSIVRAIKKNPRKAMRIVTKVSLSTMGMIALSYFSLKAFKSHKNKNIADVNNQENLLKNSDDTKNSDTPLNAVNSQENIKDNETKFTNQKPEENNALEMDTPLQNNTSEENKNTVEDANKTGDKIEVVKGVINNVKSKFSGVLPDYSLPDESSSSNLIEKEYDPSEAVNSTNW